MSDNTEIEPIDREQLFIAALGEYPTIKEAGLKAGYSEAYCNADLCRKLKNPKFLSKLREFYKSQKHVQLPYINAIEKKALDRYYEDPELAIKNPGLLKDLKTAAGIQQEEPSRPTFINIKNLQELSLHILNQQPEQIEDAEIIE